MLSPQKFGKQTGISYDQVLVMCKNGEINAIRTSGGHYKIPEKELDKFLKTNDYVSKEDYEKVIRENEKLKTLINQMKLFISNLDAEN